MARYFQLAARLLLGAVFLYAAWTKLQQSWLVFAMSIDSYQLMPLWAVHVVARGLPWVEAALGVLLLVGYQVRWVAGFSTLILLGFFIAMLRSYGAGMGIDCGCFGVGEAISPKTLARDGALLSLCGGLTFAAMREARRAQ